MLVYRTNIVITGNGDFVIDPGEASREMETGSKEHSRRVNYPIATRGGSDKK